MRGRRRLQVSGAISDHGQTLKFVLVDQPLEGSGFAAGRRGRLRLVEAGVVACPGRQRSVVIAGSWRAAPGVMMHSCMSVDNWEQAPWVCDPRHDKTKISRKYEVYYSCSDFHPRQLC